MTKPLPRPFPLTERRVPVVGWVGEGSVVTFYPPAAPPEEELPGRREHVARRLAMRPERTG